MNIHELEALRDEAAAELDEAEERANKALADVAACRNKYGRLSRRVSRALAHGAAHFYGDTEE